MGRGSTDGDGSQVLFGDFARRGGTPKERWEQVSELQLLLRDRDDASHARLLTLLETLDLGPEDLDESGAAELTEYVRQDGVQLKKHVIDVQILLGDRPDESENGELRRRLADHRAFMELREKGPLSEDDFSELKRYSLFQTRDSRPPVRWQ